MKSRHTLLAALAAFAFSAAAIAAPIGPCKQCRIEYQACLADGGWDGTRDCETPFSQCLLGAGCPLE